MDFITKILQNHEIAGHITEHLKDGKVLLEGITPSLYPHLINLIRTQTDKQLLIVTHNEHEGRKIYDQLAPINSDVAPFLLDEFMTATMLSASSDLRFERLNTLKALSETTLNSGLIIANTSALRRYLPRPDAFKKAEVLLEVDQSYDIEALVVRLNSLGYERMSTVETVGQYALRGGILDVFPKEHDDPIRVEFFDDEIETIRVFDVQSQRSKGKIESVHLTVLYELIYTEAETRDFEQKALTLLERQLEALEPHAKETLEGLIHQDILKVKTRGNLDLMHKYAALIYDEPATLIDYLDNPLIIWLNGDKISLHHETAEDELQAWENQAALLGEVLVGYNMQADFSFDLSDSFLMISEATPRIQHLSFSQSLLLESRQTVETGGNLDVFAEESHRALAESKTVIVVSESSELRGELIDKLTAANLSVAAISSTSEVVVGAVNVAGGTLDAGFELVSAGLIIYSDAELSKQKLKKKTAYKGCVQDSKRIKDYQELVPGDIVVHLQNGIGRYVGVETIDMLGIKRDVLTLEYQRGDRVYVPIDKIDMVQKYVGSEGVVPRLSRLGTKDWENTRKRASQTVKDIAKELIEVYAKRKYLPGFAFSRDGQMQAEFEAACPFVPTEDQLFTTSEIKKDMEAPHPMDRLLIGDVGYGKTEVAMRAAMKAVVDGKQVAYVAPTTILARQQYENFKTRFANFPITIRRLNRHVQGAELSETLRLAAEGKVDVLIGTHRLLSKDVVFKDLGLLIVDEEQRFGVEHKEAVKQLKTDIDVLTLTATPIPRTMQMSLIGIRPISVIETPPLNRYPVQTYVLEAHDGVIKDAIERELARDGQVFYLHNRTSTLRSHVAKIQRLVPEARGAYVHGKMSRETIEGTMEDFEDGLFDVLVCTTIIETGIDIPNANTLIVGDAYRLGLSQMYQLRGRVGRSDRIAYAYFLYPKNYILSENSEKRLSTIREFTALGSGFKIAMRDLAIRGAGDMLGTRQQGFLDTIGLDLYTKMLAEAIRVADKGSEEDLLSLDDLTASMLEAAAADLDIGVGIDRYIPDEYIEDSSLKIEMYKKMKAVATASAYEEIQLEFKDRFGPIPEGVQSLIDLMYLKQLIQGWVAKTKMTRDVLTFEFKAEMTAKVDVNVLYGAAKEAGNVKVLYKNDIFIVQIELNEEAESSILTGIQLFEKLEGIEII